MDEAPDSTLNLARLAELDDLDVEGTPSLVVELIDDFLSSAPETLASIREAHRNDSRDALQYAAHSLKGSSLNIGADGLARLCSDLEKSGKVASSAALAEMIDAVERGLDRVEPALNAERDRRAAKP
jgi:two-component system, sensor histidine kinase and response regulator